MVVIYFSFIFLKDGEISCLLWEQGSLTSFGCCAYTNPTSTSTCLQHGRELQADGEREFKSTTSLACDLQSGTYQKCTAIQEYFPDSQTFPILHLTNTPPTYCRRLPTLTSKLLSNLTKHLLLLESIVLLGC
jgi:hypothetical protein